MPDEIYLDLLGQRRVIFDDDSVTHYTDEIYFLVPIPLPAIGVGITYSVTTNRPIPYSAVHAVGVLRKRQWWALVMGLIFCPMWLYCMGAGLFIESERKQFSWGIFGFFAIWLVVTGLFPLWLFYRGRPFLVIASEHEAICLPMDRDVAKLRQIFEILKQRVTSPTVRWEITKV